MNKHNNKTTIFFDLFGVLLGTDQSVIVHYISKQIGLPYSKTHEIVLGEMFMRLVRREITFNTYCDAICSVLPKGDSIDKMVLKNKWQDAGISEMPAVSLLNELHGFYGVWIISNTSENHIVQLKTKFDFFKHIDGIITSEGAGAYKPSKKIFNFALSEANTDPLSSLFIDDSNTNVISAENMGFKVHHYFNFEKFQQFIQAYI